MSHGVFYDLWARHPNCLASIRGMHYWVINKVEPLQNRLKKVDLLGSLGAGILGAGLALLFAHSLTRFAFPALLIGILVHGWAMFEKGRIEKLEHWVVPKWAILAQRGCWIILAALMLYIAGTLLLQSD